MEKAFHSEGLAPKVFDVNAVSGVPDSALLRREPLSIVKLHGSAYGLRLGESTNDELDDTTRERLLDYVPPRAVLLVLGFSGYERRMMNVIESIATQAGEDEGQPPTIVWMHWEPEDRLSDQVRRLRTRLELLPKKEEDQRLLMCRLADAGLFLNGLYQRITRTLPATRLRYSALPKRVIAIPDEAKTTPENNATQGKEQEAAAPSGEREIQGAKTNVQEQGENPATDDKSLRQASTAYPQEFVQLFIREGIFGKDAPQEDQLEDSARASFAGLVNPDLESNAYFSMRMSDFIRGLGGYDVIWVDLEEHHTVTGVVNEIIANLRIYDPSLPPLVLPLAEYGDTSKPDPVRFDRAARYIQRALRRGRYAFAFDSIEGFGRPQTAHHGLTKIDGDNPALNAFWGQSKNDIRKFESILHDKYNPVRKGAKKDDKDKGGEQSEPSIPELHHYRRLLDLLAFFRVLLRIGDEEGEDNKKDKKIEPE